MVGHGPVRSGSAGRGWARRGAAGHGEVRQGNPRRWWRQGDTAPPLATVFSPVATNFAWNAGMKGQPGQATCLRWRSLVITAEVDAPCRARGDGLRGTVLFDPPAPSSTNSDTVDLATVISVGAVGWLVLRGPTVGHDPNSLDKQGGTPASPRTLVVAPWREVGERPVC